MATTQGEPAAVCEVVAKQPGFFLFSESTELLRTSLHEIVDEFIDAMENKKNESKSETQE